MPRSAGVVVDEATQVFDGVGTHERDLGFFVIEHGAWGVCSGGK
jgi:hypothetical protein